MTDVRREGRAMQGWRGFLWTCIVLLFASPAWAVPGIRLPADEDQAAWRGALQLAGLAAQEEDARLRLDNVEGGLLIVARTDDGRERSVAVDVPVTESDREAIAFLARGLLREVLRSGGPRPASSTGRRGLPIDKAPGSAGPARPAPPSKGTTARPGALRGVSWERRGRDVLRRSGTDEAEGPDVPSELHVERIERVRSPRSVRRVEMPPLWLRFGGAARPGFLGSPQFMAGVRVLHRGRMALNVDLGGVMARELRVGTPLSLGHFDVEATATWAVLGRGAVGGGVGTSWRRYRQQGELVGNQVVPTAQVRLDVPVVRSRRLQVMAQVQGKLDLVRTEQLQADGSTRVLSPVEIQPALVLRYHGALDALPEQRRSR